MQAEHHELAQMAEAQPAFYKSSRRRYFRERIHAKGCICWDIVNYSGHFCRFDASLLLRLQRALLMWGLYLGRCPRLYTAALAARAGCGGILTTSEVPANIPAGIARKEKINLWTSKDGSQLAKDGSGKRGGRSP